MHYRVEDLIEAIDSLIDKIYTIEDLAAKYTAVTASCENIKEILNYINNNQEYSDLLIKLETLYNIFSVYYEQ